MLAWMNLCAYASNFCVFVLQGHTVFDLADKDMLKVLEELKKKQVTVSDHILATFSLLPVNDTCVEILTLLIECLKQISTSVFVPSVLGFRWKPAN